MTAWMLVGAAGVVLFQILLGMYVHVDANRRNLDQLGLYFYGVSMPLVGLLIAVAYFARRDQLPTQDLSVPTAAEPDGTVTWTVEHRGLRRLPFRLACVIQSGQTFWRVGVVVPLLLLVLAVLVHPAITLAAAMVWQLYFFFYLNGASTFTDTTVRLAPDERTIETTTRGGDHLLSFGGGQHEIDLTDVEQAALTRVGDQPLVTFRYERPLSNNPLMVPASPAHVEDLRQTFAELGIPLRDHLRDGTNSSLVRRRIAATACSFVIVALVAGSRWPEYFFAGPILPFVFFALLWLVLKPFV